MPASTLWSLLLALAAASLCQPHEGAMAFSSPLMCRRIHVSALFGMSSRDSDNGEMIVGGERYEMVPLPDSMMDTTLFVGNLCEFVQDGHLSDLFQAVSKLNSLPACVARKATYDSLQYGFVTFPTVEEKEDALIRFHGYELMGRPLRLERIRDSPNVKRVKVPGKLVQYLCGEAKKTRNGNVNSLRRARGNDSSATAKKPSKKPKKQPSPKLSDIETREMERAVKRGYVTLQGTGFRRGRRASPLANAHREFCDNREKPQIILCKASGGRILDNVIVDLSPLRIGGILEDKKLFEDVIIKWKTEILLAADEAGMELRSDYVEDNTLDFTDDRGDEEEECQTEFLLNIEDAQSWALEPIWKLPCVSLGVFEGPRSHAKAMANALAELWEIPEQLDEESIELVSKTRRPKDKGKFREKRGMNVKP